MCECMMIPEQRTASIIGLREPAANGAIVSGISATDMALLNRQQPEMGGDQVGMPFKNPVVAAVRW